MRLGTPVAVSGLDAEHAAERRVLEQALCAHSTRWAEWIATLSEAQLNGTLCYANMSGAGFEQPLAALLLHVFNQIGRASCRERV